MRTRIVINDREELQTFVTQLKLCGKKSDHGGGGYSAFLRHKDGRIEVEVCLPVCPPVKED